MPGSDISIVVPTYNEAGNIAPFVKRAEAALAGLDWEILFVDDNSPDGTADVVRALARSDDRVRLVLRLADRGLAKASIQGMLSAKGDLLCVMDGDGQHDPEAIKRMIEPIRAGEAEIVSAARQLDEHRCGGTRALPPQPIETRQPALRLRARPRHRRPADRLLRHPARSVPARSPGAARPRLQAAARHLVVGPQAQAQRGAVRFRAAAARQIQAQFLRRLAVRHLSA